VAATVEAAAAAAVSFFRQRHLTGSHALATLAAYNEYKMESLL
jgi:hypothetical protein